MSSLAPDPEYQPGQFGPPQPGSYFAAGVARQDEFDAIMLSTTVSPR